MLSDRPRVNPSRRSGAAEAITDPDRLPLLVAGTPWHCLAVNPVAKCPAHAIPAPILDAPATEASAQRAQDLRSARTNRKCREQQRGNEGEPHLNIPEHDSDHKHVCD